MSNQHLSDDYDQAIEQVELSLENAQRLVDQRDQLKKLMNNREFKKLILEDLFKEEPARLVAALGDPALKDAQDDIRQMMLMISNLQQHFNKIIMLGNMAETSVAEHRQVLADIHEEMNQ